MILVTGYNIMANDSFLVSLAKEFPTVPIIFNSQIGAFPKGSTRREGPGWRLLVADEDNSTSPHDVPFDDLVQSGITLI